MQVPDGRPKDGPGPMDPKDDATLKFDIFGDRFGTKDEKNHHSL